MATWITHLWVADNVLACMPDLDRHSFCIGNIAPDCNIENEDWTQFTPSREVTHWMSADRKVAADCDRFFEAYITSRKHQIATTQELSFLLGYYAHLVTDAEFQSDIRDPERVTAAWRRIKTHPALSSHAAGMPENWDSIKKLIPTKERMKDIYTMEAEYLTCHPQSGYLTEVLPVASFPDYIDYLPKGAIVRKVRVMGYLPKKEQGEYPFIAMTREEFACFLNRATQKIIQKLSCQF